MVDEVRHLLDQGRELYDKGEFAEAEARLEKVLHLDRGHANVFDMLGVIAHRNGRFTEAAKHFEEALRLNPTYTDAALNLSVTLNELGRYEEARQVYASAMAQSRSEPGQLDPFVRGKLANMHAAVGDAYAELRMFEAAVIELRKALALCPTFSDLRVRLAMALRDLGERESAVQELEEAKRHNPSFLPARIHLGVTLYSLGRTEEAAREWRQVLVDDPGNKSCKAYLSIIGK